MVTTEELKNLHGLANKLYNELEMIDTSTIEDEETQDTLDDITASMDSIQSTLYELIQDL